MTKSVPVRCDLCRRCLRFTPGLLILRGQMRRGTEGVRRHRRMAKESGCQMSMRTCLTWNAEDAPLQPALSSQVSDCPTSATYVGGSGRQAATISLTQTKGGAGRRAKGHTLSKSMEELNQLTEQNLIKREESDRRAQIKRIRRKTAEYARYDQESRKSLTRTSRRRSERERDHDVHRVSYQTRKQPTTFKVGKHLFWEKRQSGARWDGEQGMVVKWRGRRKMKILVEMSKEKTDRCEGIEVANSLRQNSTASLSRESRAAPAHERRRLRCLSAVGAAPRSLYLDLAEGQQIPAIIRTLFQTENGVATFQSAQNQYAAFDDVERFCKFHSPSLACLLQTTAGVDTLATLLPTDLQLDSSVYGYGCLMRRLASGLFQHGSLRSLDLSGQYLLEHLPVQELVAISSLVCLKCKDCPRLSVVPAAVANEGGLVVMAYLRLACPLVSLVVRTPSGFKWENCGTERPSEGREFGHPVLAEVLRRQTKFSQQEWDDLCISDLRMDHFIKSGSSYFKPSVRQGRATGRVTKTMLVLGRGSAHLARLRFRARRGNLMMEFQDIEWQEWEGREGSDAVTFSDSALQGKRLELTCLQKRSKTISLRFLDQSLPAAISRLDGWLTGLRLVANLERLPLRALLAMTSLKEVTVSSCPRAFLSCVTSPEEFTLLLRLLKMVNFNRGGILGADGTLDLSSISALIQQEADQAQARARQIGLTDMFNQFLCPGLQDLDGRITILDVSGHPDLERLPVEILANMRSLKAIRCRGCPRIVISLLQSQEGALQFSDLVRSGKFETVFKDSKGELDLSMRSALMQGAEPSQARALADLFHSPGFISLLSGLDGILCTLNVSDHTHLQRLPTMELAAIASLKSLNCSGCPQLADPPKEVHDQEGEAVMSFLRQCATRGTVNMDIELITIGNGECGKTSTVCCA